MIKIKRDGAFQACVSQRFFGPICCQVANGRGFPHLACDFGLACWRACPVRWELQDLGKVWVAGKEPKLSYQNMGMFSN